jgi:hypothetical protein
VNVETPGVDGNRDVTVSLSASLKQGQTPKDPAERRVFVVRAFRVRGTEAPVLLTVANGGVIESDSLTTRIIGGVAVSEAGGGGNQSLDFDNPGPPFERFLIVNRNPTDASGAALLRFQVGPTQVDDDDQVVVQVEAVIESTTTPPQFIGCGPAGNLCFVNISVPSDKALSQWDFPRTGEVNSQGRGTVPPSP